MSKRRSRLQGCSYHQCRAFSVLTAAGCENRTGRAAEIPLLFRKTINDRLEFFSKDRMDSRSWVTPLSDMGHVLIQPMREVSPPKREWNDF
ncbi:hypothetical protein ILYODFUR_025425 [Ilyodon furcidens]|uniref:Uncharacterized protein n=1 Tax=Ilyodon furcidens TaxID=33524 RepID=A0ABV0SP67_9TELE